MNPRLKAASAAMLASAWLLLAPQASAFASDVGASGTEQPSRFSRSAEGRSAASSNRSSSNRSSELAKAPVSEFDALQTEGARVSPGRSSRGKIIDTIANAEIAKASHETVDFWFYGAGTEVFYDFDRDGYFHGLTVFFDADVSDGVADVFAELYLSRNGGPWNLYHTTRVFSIFGASADDEYEVVTELDSGYPSGDYDVLVELYDADSGDFLADIGPVDDIALAYLPLEDAGWDAPPIYDDHYYGGGGSTGPAVLLILFLLIAWRQRQQDRLALTATAPARRAPVER